jgi:PAS domain S-box-containing protein
VNGFVKTLKEELQLDGVIVLDRLNNEKWQANVNQDSGHSNVHIPQSYISRLGSEGAIVVSDNQLPEGTNDSTIYSSQIFISILPDRVLMLYRKDQDINESDYRWLIKPSRAFNLHYNFLESRIQKSNASSESSAMDVLSCKYERVKYIQDVSPIGQIILDVHDNVVSYNQSAELFVEALFNEQISSDLKEDKIVVSDRFLDKCKQRIQYVKNGNSAEYEEEFLMGDSVIYTKFNCHPLYSHDKVLNGVVILITNITELNNSRASAEKNRNVLQTILNMSSSGYMVYNNDFEIIYFNKPAKDVHKEVLGIDLKEGMHFEEITKNPSSFWHKPENKELAYNLDKPFENLYSYLNDENEVYLRFKLSLHPIYNENNEKIGFLENVVDETQTYIETKKIDDQLSTLNAVLDGAFNSIYAIDEEMNVLAINKNAQQDFMDYCGKMINVGDNFNDFIDPDTLKQWRLSYYDKALAGESLNFVGLDSNKRNVESNFSPVRDKDDDIVGVIEVCRDISELTQSKQDLQYNEEQLRILVENVPTGIIRCDDQGKIIDVSKSVTEILGYDSATLKNAFLVEYIHEHERNYIIDYVKSIGPDNHRMTSATFLHKDGSHVHVQGQGIIIRQDVNAAGEYLFTFNDVTENREMERSLELVKGNYELLFKTMYDSTLVLDYNNWDILDCNRSFLEFYGVETVDRIKKNKLVPQFSDYFPEEDLWQEFDNLIKSISKGQPAKTTTVFLNNKLEQRLVELSIVPSQQIEDVALIVLKDITESYKVSKENSEKTAIYEKLIANSAEGIDIVEFELISDINLMYEPENFKAKTIVRNELMTNIFHDATNPMLDLNNFLSILPEEQPNGVRSKDLVYTVIKNLTDTGKSIDKITFNVGGKLITAMVTQNILSLNNKYYVIRHILDISDKLKAQAIIDSQIVDLNSKNLELQKYIDSNLQLENFAYIASHDLKAPIRSVISFMQLLKKNVESKIGEKDMRFVNIVLEASMNMQILIDDLLDYSRINTQKLVYEPTDVGKMLKDLQRDLSTVIEESNSIIEIQDNLPVIVADYGRIRQVFQNLITNGIKFIKKGAVPVINISMKETKSHYQFTITDNGIGIEEDYLDKIFLMFKKLHSENKYQGTGIGLSICKKAIDQHKGNIWVESELNKGSAFHFTISKDIKADSIKRH